MAEEIGELPEELGVTLRPHQLRTRGAEAGGLLQLNSANGAATANAAGFSRVAVIGTLLTSTTGGATQLGIGDVLTLSGTFGLTIPTGPYVSGYGVRFSDSANNVTHQLAQLYVGYNDVIGQSQIAYILQDFDADTITTLGATLLGAPVGADQIRLTISRPSTTAPSGLRQTTGDGRPGTPAGSARSSPRPTMSELLVWTGKPYSVA